MTDALTQSITLELTAAEDAPGGQPEPKGRLISVHDTPRLCDLRPGTRCICGLSLRSRRRRLTTVTSKHLYYVALGGGASIWLLTMAISGRSETWDSPLYWSIAYPLCIALGGRLRTPSPRGRGAGRSQ